MKSLRLKSILFAILACALFVSCSDDDDNEKVLTMTIASRTTTCQALPSGQEYGGYIVKEGKNGWKPFCNYISGFTDYTEGFEYMVKVKQIYIEIPREDGSSYEYELIEIISKTEKESEGIPDDL